MDHWVEVCGVGPWFCAEQLPLDEFRYKDRPYDLKVSIALANSGDVQLEGGSAMGGQRTFPATRQTEGLRRQ